MSCNVFAVDVDAPSLDDLHRLVERLWSTETFGCACDEDVSLLVEDRRALATMEDSIKKVSGHYEVGMLWRADSVTLPNNRVQAYRRFTSLRRKLAGSPVLKQKYDSVMKEYLDKGYAQPLTATEVQSKSGREYYLPHHGVENPNKSKIRIVFDAAASYGGVRLNSNLLKGPDMSSSLLGVLVRFREGQTVLSADIKEMFHQVGVQDYDQSVLRFLWTDPSRRHQRSKSGAFIYSAQPHRPVLLTTH